ncbi:DUF3857 domain-containing protein [Ekhidna sp.]
MQKRGNRTRIILQVLFTTFVSLGSAQILKYETKVELIKETLVTERSYLIQVNSSENRDWGEIIIPHGDNDNFTLLSAEILDKDGEVVYRPKKKDILTRNRFSESSFHEDDQITELNLFWNEYPYQIKYSYKRSARNYTYLLRWTPPVDKGITPLVSNVEVIVPQNTNIHINSTDEFNLTENIENGKRRMKWTLLLKEIPGKEVYSPIYWENLPSIIVAPESFKYGVEGSLSSWSEYGDWFLKLNSGIDEITFEEKINVKNILKGQSNLQDSIAALYHYLQDNTTYVNVSIDLGGLRSYPASYVCENKFGDCKALTTYMKGLLNYAGVQSNYVLIDAGNNYYSDGWIVDESPGPQFNHIVLAVPTESDTIWLENTSTVLPTDYVGTSLQNRKSLWLEEGQSQLIEMPKLSLEDVMNKSIFNFQLDTIGSGELNSTITMRGKSFEQTRYRNKSLKKDEIENRIKRDVKIKKFTLENYEIIDESRDSLFNQIKISGVVKGQIQEIEDIKAIRPPKIKIPDFEKSDGRKRDVKINMPINEMITSSYDLTSFDQISLAPKEVSLDSKYGSYKFTIINTDRVIEVNQHFTLKRGYYSIDEYPEFYQFISKVKNNQKKLAVVFTTN